MRIVMTRVSLLLLALSAVLLPGVAIVVALERQDSESRAPAHAVVLEQAQASGAEGGRGIAAGQTPTDTAISTVYLPLFARTFMTAPFDMVDFLVGDEERLFEVQHSSGSQARHQTQVEGQTFYHTKWIEWEELWYDGAYIYRGTDTSPGNGQYYTLRDPQQYGSKWAPRFWSEGDLFFRRPYVTFYSKSTCQPQGPQGWHPSYLRFDKYHASYTFQSGITLYNVVELSWLSNANSQPLERYFYAESYGLVGWWSSSGAHSYVSEIHPPGTHPDNSRESIACLDKSPLKPPYLSRELLYWPGQHRR